MPRFRLLASIAFLTALAAMLVWQHRAEQKTAALAGDLSPAAAASRQAQNTSRADSQALPADSMQHPEQSATQSPAIEQLASRAGKSIDSNHAHELQRRQPLSDRKLADLLERRLTPAMRRAINEQLQPGGSPPRERQGRYGSYLDFSDRAASVMIAVIDDDGNTVITDVMQALPETGQ